MLLLPPTRRRGPPAVGRRSKTNLTPAHLAGGWEVEQGHDFFLLVFLLVLLCPILSVTLLILLGHRTFNRDPCILHNGEGARRCMKRESIKSRRGGQPNDMCSFFTQFILREVTQGCPVFSHLNYQQSSPEEQVYRLLHSRVDICK